jgi:hypothetical protein
MEAVRLPETVGRTCPCTIRAIINQNTTLRTFITEKYLNFLVFTLGHCYISAFVCLLHKTLVAGFLIPHCTVNLDWHIQAHEVLRIHHTWTCWQTTGDLKIPASLRSPCWFSLVRFMCSGMQQRQVSDRQENSQIDKIVRVCCQICISRIDISKLSQYHVWYFHGVEDCGILGCDTVWSGRRLSVIQTAYFVCTQYENYALKMKVAGTSL